MSHPLLSPEISPNSTPKDALRSLFQLCNPWTYVQKEQRHTNELHRFFADTFSVPQPHVFSFLHARTGLHYLLKAYDIGANDSVCIQAFTCVVVPNAITALGAQPVYVDIDDTYNMDVDALRSTLQTHPHVRAVVVQHTFGIAARLAEIQKLCTEKNIVLIEDCAHALYSKYEEKLLGTFGDAAIFSFGRDKVISSINGGVAIVRSEKIAQRMREYSEALQSISTGTMISHLLHPIIFEIGKMLYRIHRKIYIVWIEFWKKARLLPLVISPEEKNGTQETRHFVLPNALSHKALVQLREIHRNIAHREKLVALYSSLLPQSLFSSQALPTYSSHALLRYTIHHPDIAHIEQKLKERGIYLGHWYDTVVAPKDASSEGAKYTLAQCPRAELVCQNIANLPTHLSISESDAHYIAETILSLASRT